MRRLHHAVSPLQAAVLRRLAACRTAALGGHRDACDRCGYSRVSYNSCRDRHCPKCQGVKRAQWLEKRLERLLPVEHFHVVFTLPAALNLWRCTIPVGCTISFSSGFSDLATLAADRKRLGAQIGVTALCTLGAKAPVSSHLHCVVTGGGLSPDGRHWIAASGVTLLPVKVLGRLFRGKFCIEPRGIQSSESRTITGSGSNEPNRSGGGVIGVYNSVASFATVNPNANATWNLWPRSIAVA